MPVMKTETGKWEVLVEEENLRQGKHAAAVDHEAAEGEAATKDKMDDDASANNRYDTQTQKINAILESDKKYLEDELAAIEELEELVKKLNIKGDYGSTNVAPPAPVAQVAWHMGGLTGASGLSCVDVCNMYGATCDDAALAALKTDADYKEAYASAGFPCDRWNTHCVNGDNCAKWGVPFIHSSHMNDKICWKGDKTASCPQVPVDGHHNRLCPCSQ